MKEAQTELVWVGIHKDPRIKWWHLCIRDSKEIWALFEMMVFVPVFFLAELIEDGNITSALQVAAFSTFMMISMWVIMIMMNKESFEEVEQQLTWRQIKSHPVVPQTIHKGMKQYIMEQQGRWDYLDGKPFDWKPLSELDPVILEDKEYHLIKNS